MTLAPLICIVEDEQDLAQLMDEYLRANGYRTRQIHTGTEADAWLVTNKPDLLLFTAVPLT